MLSRLAISGTEFPPVFKYASDVDFAIGSPFGASGGSVYVVYGGADPEKAVSSRLTSPVSNQASSQLSSFGFSAAGNTDIDRNTVLGTQYWNLELVSQPLKLIVIFLNLLYFIVS